MTVYERVNEIYLECVLAYRRQHMDKELQEEYEARCQAEEELRKQLSRERLDTLDELLALYKQRESFCVQYGWQMGTDLCMRAFKGDWIGYPREEEAVSDYMQTYILEQLPRYCELSNAVSELLNAERDRYGEEENYNTIKDYHEGLEFDLLQVAHYLGYLEGNRVFSQTKSGYVENRDLTLTYLRRMGDSAYAGKTDELLMN